MIAIFNSNNYIFLFVLFFYNLIYSQRIEPNIKVGFNSFYKSNKIKLFYSYYVDFNTKDTTYSKYFFTKEGYLKKKEFINGGVFDVEIIYNYDDCYNLISIDSLGLFGYSSGVLLQVGDSIIKETQKKYYNIIDTSLLFFKKEIYYYNIKENDDMFRGEINDTIVDIDYYYYNNQYQIEKSLHKHFVNQKLILQTTSNYYYRNNFLNKVEFYSGEKKIAIKRYFYEYYTAPP